jgi:hypothetical protein
MKNLFKVLVKITQEEIFHQLPSILCLYGYTPTSCEKSIYAEGQIPIALIAHLDTVFPEHTRNNLDIFYDQKREVLWSPDGLGADDRAGIAMILQILATTDLRPHLLFTCDEESSLAGAKELAKMPCPFKELSYIIELDRQGTNDCVFYQCGNHNFQQYIQTFGFDTALGSYTDISIIGPAWNVACVNLSVGYYNEHSLTEYLNCKEWEYTFTRLKTMLTKPTLVPWLYQKEEYPVEPLYTCDFCDRRFSLSELDQIILDKNSYLLLCKSCQKEAHVKECKSCGKLFLPYGNEHICDICYEEYTKDK